MKKDDLIKKGLNEGQADEILELFNNIINEKYVEKSLYDEVCNENDVLKQGADENKELKKEIERLNIMNEEAEKKHSEDMDAIKIDNAIERALLISKAKTDKAVKAMLDMEKIGFDSEGNITGIDEQIEALVRDKDTAYLFESNIPTLKGTRLGYGADDTGVDTTNMNYEELCAYMASNPDII